MFIFDLIKNVGTNPVFQTPLYQRYNKNTNIELDKLNAEMEKFCAERRYDFVDLRPFLCRDGDIIDEYVQDLRLVNYERHTYMCFIIKDNFFNRRVLLTH